MSDERCACGEEILFSIPYEGFCRATCPVHGIVASGIDCESGGCGTNQRQWRTAQENCLIGLAMWNENFTKLVTP
jgi:hypothetical protein